MVETIKQFQSYKTEKKKKEKSTRIMMKRFVDIGFKVQIFKFPIAV